MRRNHLALPAPKDAVRSSRLLPLPCSLGCGKFCHAFGSPENRSANWVKCCPSDKRKRNCDRGVIQLSVLGYLIGALNLVFAIGLILAMVLHITEQEASGGGGWGIVGGRHILSSQSGMATFVDRVITWLAVGWIATAFLVAIIFRP